MNIPEKAIEAGAQELYAEQRSTSDGFDMWPEWEDAPEVGRGAFRDEALAVLKAAAPFIRADSQRHSGIRIDRRKLEGWDDAPPLTGQDWREFAESLPASEHATAILAIADALDEGAR